MAYENISTYKLNNALNKIDNINYENINNLKSKLTSDQWGSPIRSRIKTALQDLISEYKAIQKEIKDYKTAAELIKDYQEANDDYDRYVQKANDYRQKYEQYKYKTDLDANDEYWKNHYKNKYNEYMNMKSSAQNSKNQLKNRINNLIK